MKASTAVSSSPSVSSHKSAAPSPSPHIWTFHLKSSPSSSRMFSPLFVMPSPIRRPTARPRRFKLYPLCPPVPLVILVYKCMFWDIPIIYFEDAIATKLLLLLGRALLERCQLPRMSCVTPSDHQVKDNETALPKRPDYSVAA